MKPYVSNARLIRGLVMRNDRAKAVATAGRVPRPGADRRPTIVYPELGLDILGVSPYGVQRHHKLPGDIRTVQVGTEQSKYVELTFT
jgi:hypothetical protein